jgi:hypothetical protein
MSPRGHRFSALLLAVPALLVLAILVGAILVSGRDARRPEPEAVPVANLSAKSPVLRPLPSAGKTERPVREEKEVSAPRREPARPPDKEVAKEKAKLPALTPPEPTPPEPTPPEPKPSKPVPPAPAPPAPKPVPAEPKRAPPAKKRRELLDIEKAANALLAARRREELNTGNELAVKEAQKVEQALRASFPGKVIRCRLKVQSVRMHGEKEASIAFDPAHWPRPGSAGLFIMLSFVDEKGSFSVPATPEVARLRPGVFLTVTGTISRVECEGGRLYIFRLRDTALGP